MIKKDFLIDLHPGELLTGMLEDEHISQAKLASALGNSRKVVNEICLGKRGISAEMAVKLGKVLGQTPEFWMRAQTNWELSRVDKKVAQRVRRLVGAAAA